MSLLNRQNFDPGIRFAAGISPFLEKWTTFKTFQC